jgi:predicted acetyltransferase
MTVDTVRLVRPDVRYHESFLDALAESIAEGRNPGIHRPAPTENFPDFIDRLRGMEEPCRVEAGFVPQSVFWLVDDDTYVGCLSLRHALTDELRRMGGHIGYDIRPTFRRRGYGTRTLALGLDEARRIGLERVLLTCDKDNLASRRVIERNGGVLEDEVIVPSEDGIKRRYWIDL